MSRLYQAYYTKCEPILNYMVSKLNLRDGDTVFEPCGGDGVFVDKVLSVNNNLSISVFELNPEAVNDLTHKYDSRTNVNVHHTDTLLNPELLSKSLKFSKIIGNPPYGAQRDEEIKKRLSQAYNNIYTKESYTLFLYTCIQSLSNHGRLSFIIPDTFLSLHRHKQIRQYLLQTTRIDEILLFPSSFFPGVNFGYANLCIITLERDYNVAENLNNTFQIWKGYGNVEQIGGKDISCSTYTQKEILNNLDSSFLISDTPEISHLINNPTLTKLGDIAHCVTGFYSGNDKTYLHPAHADLKNAKRYEIAKAEQIFKGKPDDDEKKKGIKGNRFLVPVVKGGGKRYIKPDEWYMEWSEKAISEYRSSKKCRFQNADFYFRQGIAIPMVRSSQMTAALIEGRLFDQSIVGVFPKDDKWTLYLLGFFNSDICSKIISTLNPSANNSANYIKQIPFIEPEEKDFKEVTMRVKNIADKLKNSHDVVSQEDVHWLNDYFERLYMNI